MAAVIALFIYANFFTNHFIGDYGWYIAACALGLYARSTVTFKSHFALILLNWMRSVSLGDSLIFAKALSWCLRMPFMVTAPNPSFNSDSTGTGRFHVSWS
jgi:uncharacterized membrane protein YoaT (DUF817 family)